MKFDRDYSKVKFLDIVWCVLIGYYDLTPDMPPKLGVVHKGFDETGKKLICGEPIEHYYIGDIVPVPTIELERPDKKQTS